MKNACNSCVCIWFRVCSSICVDVFSRFCECICGCINLYIGFVRSRVEVGSNGRKPRRRNCGLAPGSSFLLMSSLSLFWILYFAFCSLYFVFCTRLLLPPHVLALLILDFSISYFWYVYLWLGDDLFFSVVYLYFFFCIFGIYICIVVLYFVLMVFTQFFS